MGEPFAMVYCWSSWQCVQYEKELWAIYRNIKTSRGIFVHAPGRMLSSRARAFTIEGLLGLGQGTVRKPLEQQLVGDREKHHTELLTEHGSIIMDPIKEDTAKPLGTHFAPVPSSKFQDDHSYFKGLRSHCASRQDQASFHSSNRVCVKTKPEKRGHLTVGSHQTSPDIKQIEQESCPWYGTSYKEQTRHFRASVENVLFSSNTQYSQKKRQKLQIPLSGETQLIPTQRDLQEPGRHAADLPEDLSASGRASKTGAAQTTSATVTPTENTTITTGHVSPTELVQNETAGGPRTGPERTENVSLVSRCISQADVLPPTTGSPKCVTSKSLSGLQSSKIPDRFIRSASENEAIPCAGSVESPSASCSDSPQSSCTIQAPVSVVQFDQHADVQDFQNPWTRLLSTGKMAPFFRSAFAADQNMNPPVPAATGTANSCTHKPEAERDAPSWTCEMEKRTEPFCGQDDWCQFPRAGYMSLCWHPSVVTAKGVSHVEAKLCQADQWHDFHRLGTEMVITKMGRRMFPALRLKFRGLEPEARYALRLELSQCGRDKYRYVYHESMWVVTGTVEEESCPGDRVYTHPDSPLAGHSLLTQTVSFEKVKLTNNIHPADTSQTQLTSMLKFQPIIHLEKVQELEAEDDVNSPVRMSFVFPQTSFIAVTAYQNKQITRLKIAKNPFAKGFREKEQKKFPSVHALAPVTVYSPFPLRLPVPAPSFICPSSPFTGTRFNCKKSSSINPR